MWMNFNNFTPEQTMDIKIKSYKLNQKKMSDHLKLKNTKPRIEGSPTFGKPNSGRITTKF